MIKHIVMWRLKDDSQNIKSVAMKMKEKLESMKGKIPTLTSIQIGINEKTSNDAYDICLISEHPDWEGLKAYQEHPVHLEVGAFVKEVSKTRTVVDYEF